jgi:hypothetical protein
LFGILLQLAAARGVVSAARRCGPGQSAACRRYVGALESIGGVVEVSQGQWSIALEERNAGPHQ